MTVKATGRELSPTSELENQQSVERWLRWFKRDGEELVGETQLVGVTLTQLKEAFTPFPDDPFMYDCYRLETVEQVKLLSSWLKRELNLEAYEYFVECQAAC